VTAQGQGAAITELLPRDRERKVGPYRSY